MKKVGILWIVYLETKYVLACNRDTYSFIIPQKDKQMSDKLNKCAA